MTFISNTSAVLDRACMTLAKLFMIGMVLTVLGQIVARYLFDNPYGWTEELARYCMVWTGLLGATCAFKRGLDPVIMSLPDSAGKNMKLFAIILLGIAMALFLYPVVYYSFFGAGFNFERGFLWRSWLRTSPGMGLNMALIVSIVPITCMVLAVHWLAKLVELFNGTGKTGQQPA